MRTLILCISVITFFLSCEKKETTKPVSPPTKKELAYKEIDSLVAVFKNEAKIRNKNVSFEGITFRLNDLLSREGYWGYANPNGLIELDSSTWYNLKIANKEWLIFHELGHGVLKRQHFNRTNTNDEFHSLMFDGLAYGYGSIHYYGFRRKYYVDELFEANTPEPDWFKTPVYAINGQEKTIILKEQFNDNKNNWDLSSARLQDGTLILSSKKNINAPINIDVNADFEIEFDFKLKSPASSWGFLFGEPNKNVSFRIDLPSAISYIGYPYSIFSTQTKLPNFKATDYHKITLRKIGNMHQYFIDEKYIYHFDPIITSNKFPLLLFVNDNELEIDNLTYSLIK